METKIQPGTEVTDGFFSYVVVADSCDGWLTVRLGCHVLRIEREVVRIGS